MSATRSRLVLIAAPLVVAVLSAGPSTASSRAGSSAHARAVAARELAARGYLVPHPAAFERAKARAAARVTGPAARHAARVTGAAVQPPRADPSFAGISDPRGTPSDSTGAIGPTRYVEMVNTRFAFYKRTGKLVSR